MKNNIAELRKKNNLSQTDLSKILRVAQNTISQWELGKRDIDSATLIKLAIIFEVSIDELLNFVPKKKSNTILIHSSEEKELINCFRGLPANKKNSLLDYIRYLASQQDQELPKLKSI